MTTGESIDIFTAEKDTEWGEKREAKSDASLDSAVFFIAIITPRYFKEESCIGALMKFAAKATELGVKELLMPILYVDFSDLRNYSTPSDAISIASSFQWEVWTDLRFTERTSSEYRRAVSKMATRLARASERANSIDPSHLKGQSTPLLPIIESKL